MSTTHCETGIVRIRVGLFNDILRFDYALRIFFFLFICYSCDLSAKRDRGRGVTVNNSVKIYDCDFSL